MDNETFEKLKSDLEKERAHKYLERFGHLPKTKEEDKHLKEFN